MIYPIAVPFQRFDSLEGAIKEYNIEFRTDDSRLDDLIDFISLPFVYRVNIHFDSKVPVHIIEIANKVKDCVYVRLSPDQWFEAKGLKENDVRFFFDSSMPVSNICQLTEFIKMGVSDVYIADDLVYMLPRVGKYCSQENVNVRMVLNRIPLTTFDKGDDPRSLMCRPQDTYHLLDYIDTFEFDCYDENNNYQWNVFDVLFKAFFVNQYWHGDLSELNPDIHLPHGFPNDSITPEYTGYKVDCGRRCGLGSSCRKCQQFYDIGIEFKNKEVRFA